MDVGQLISDIQASAATEEVAERLQASYLAYMREGRQLSPSELASILVI